MEMDEGREQLIELTTSQQVTNAEFFNSLSDSCPMLAKLMLDKFKKFLTDSFFTDLERQTMLMKFFEDQTNIDLIKEIITFLENSEFKEDYIKIIMEWTYHNSENIIKQNLAKVDGSGLCQKKEKKQKLDYIKPTDEFIEVLIQLTTDLLDE